MKQIEAFVDEVYHNVDGDIKEIEELKAEMKNHLFEAVHELRREGKSEQEAIELAIARFGGEREMRSIAGQLFRAQKVFAKRFLYIAISLLIFTFVACGTLNLLDAGYQNDNQTVSSEITKRLEGKEEISGVMKKEISSLLDDQNQIISLQVYKLSDILRVSKDGTASYHLKGATPAYEYGDFNSFGKPSWILTEMDSPYGSREEWFVHMESIKFYGITPFIFNGGIAIFAVLFTIWAAINAYHHRRLKAGWVIAFALFNVVGYLIYILVGKRKVTA